MHVRYPDRAVLAIVEVAHHGVLCGGSCGGLYQKYVTIFCHPDLVTTPSLSRNRHETPVAISTPTSRGYRASDAMILAQWAAGFCAVATSIHLASIAITGLRCR